MLSFYFCFSYGLIISIFFPGCNKKMPLVLAFSAASCYTDKNLYWGYLLWLHCFPDFLFRTGITWRTTMSDSPTASYAALWVSFLIYVFLPGSCSQEPSVIPLPLPRMPLTTYPMRLPPLSPCWASGWRDRSRIPTTPSGMAGWNTFPGCWFPWLSFWWALNC